MTYPPRPPDDEPRSQPFQPMSYDLAPEFGTPPPPPADAPAYGPPPGYQQPPPPAPAYPPAAYQAPAPVGPPPVVPPGYGPGPAYPAPPPMVPSAPPKKASALKVTLSIVGGVFLVCAIAACVFLYPVFSEAGATVSAPATLPGGLQKQDSDTMQQLADSLESDLRNDLDTVDQVAAGIYADGNEQKPVILVAATSTILSPASELDKAFKGFSSGSDTIGSPTEYDAGKWGGKLRCAEGTSSEINMTVCAWADHGSLGVGVFVNRGAPESAALFRDIRDVVQNR
ncbi:hypothetical protein ACFFX1_11275 [Dactylosporangium sucinum]|uniref:Uncharacterized protein n=1 Tax=Dactylosporangium sucinum TaxID=1424081 RepID=A0A917TM90_9ACTN|nr:hypothetical protein [Dactylosporangium sucinum]GGM28626.1 hypothetical protein GCM10007977_032380 [Dactylosporangium sucinum]